ncbi:MAG: hypothetical protein COT15_00010 [Candidatus Diapherotrites archaeon CG08_land_8_20_14_0_20_34_12]|nr:MAG: hypothetical protein COT15_00010 [Candidatus Diapherotrites archaeon CG08_land_8_20_14_0_20_34_12]
MTEFGEMIIAESDAYAKAVEKETVRAFSKSKTAVPYKVTTRNVIQKRPQRAAKRVAPRHIVA